MGVERRKERRLRANLPIKLISGGEEFLTRTENISALGAYMEAEHTIPVGADVDLILEIPLYSKDTSLSGEVRCKGSVFRSSVIREFQTGKFYGIGVFFTTFLRDEDKKKLFSYVDYLIQSEEQDIKEGLKKWKFKREAHKAVRVTEQMQVHQEEFQSKTVEALNKILQKLDDIAYQLQSQHKQ